MDFTFKRQEEKICRACGQMGGKHSTSCPEYPKTLIKEMDNFVFTHGHQLLESGKKLDAMLDKNMEKWSCIPVEMRLAALDKMRQEREKRIESFSRPPQDLVNEVKIIKAIIDKFHPMG